MQMPSTFSAKDSKVLVAIRFACQKTTPTASMISLAGWKMANSSIFRFAYRAQMRAGDRQGATEFINHVTNDASSANARRVVDRVNAFSEGAQGSGR
jgi:hypothetical protein